MIGKELGMFVDRSQLVWDGDFSKLSDAQLDTMLDCLERQRTEEMGKASPAVKEAK